MKRKRKRNQFQYDTKHDRIKLAVVIAAEVLIAVAVLAAATFFIQWLVEVQPAITLATDKETYVLGDVVVFFGRSYNYPNQEVTFHLYVDQASPSLRAEFDSDFTANPPEWAFAVSWTPTHAGRFSAYITGPNHTASSEIEFQVVEAVPIPELHAAQVTMLLTMAAAFTTVMVHRRRR
jgi:hypothetical protein